jgi:hypothetical protein
MKNKDPIINIPEFWDFVLERQAIWYRRFVENKPAPWTEDAILRDNRFTNMYRCLDKGTLYPIWEIISDKISVEDKLFQLVMYRLLNRISSYKVLRRPVELWDKDEWHRGVIALRDKKQAIMTSAYVPITMVTGGEVKGVVNKIAEVGAILQPRIGDFLEILQSAWTMQDAHEHIRRFPAPYKIGPFVAFQILLDLTYEGSVLDLEPDEWVYMGPGSRKSIGELGKKHGMKPDVVCEDLWFHQKTHLKGLNFKWLHDRESGGRHMLSLADIEHCLCEWYKYKNLGKGGNVKPNAGPGEYTPPRQLPPWLEV